MNIYIHIYYIMNGKSLFNSQKALANRCLLSDIRLTELKAFCGQCTTLQLLHFSDIIQHHKNVWQ